MRRFLFFILLKRLLMYSCRHKRYDKIKSQEKKVGAKRQPSFLGIYTNSRKCDNTFVNYSALRS
ncbi:hypothetical protein Pse7429DRAFT_2185, partial [Pseudanabaena biceps PCC 7429]